MLISYYIFWRKPALPLYRVLLWAILTGLALPVSAVNCFRSPVYVFSQALYLEQYKVARDQLEIIERERTPDLALFLSQVLKFKQAYDADDPSAQRVALDAIDHLLETRFIDSGKIKPLESRVLTANMVIHAARLNLAAERLLRAIGLAKQGRQQLDILALDKTASGVLLANGLYDYYTSNDEQRLARTLLGFADSGDRERGKKFIESAVEQSPDYAFEAARSLMADVNWNRFDTCRYIPLFDQPKGLDSLSMGHRQQGIAANLFCGYLYQAQREIERIEAFTASEKITLSTTQDDWLFSARLYGLAASADLAALKRILASLSQDEQHRIEQTQFALAKAWNAAGDHVSAAVLYRQTLESELDESYLILARAYLKNPYQTPRPFDRSRMVRLKFACASDN
jgi:hypothetical protein